MSRSKESQREAEPLLYKLNPPLPLVKGKGIKGMGLIKIKSEGWRWR